MRKISEKGFGAAAAGLAFLVAACGSRPDGPAPVVSGEAAATAEPVQVKVRPGQTLSGIAHTYRVPMQLVAEANHLAPPYRIETGRILIIPQSDQSAASIARPLAAFPPTSEQMASTKPPEAVPLERTTLPPPENPPAAATTPAHAASAASAPIAEPSHPDVKPAATAPAPTATTEPPAATATPSGPASDSGSFLWPVRGHVVAGYGTGRDGTHNDGINIVAPRGAAIEAADRGVVAYAGNELRGYGNLILVKHSNGWISAYAHCDSILVKRGDKVSRGQTIARVGSTGSVAEPQLHFELRHGNHAVDPREFLAPLPTADTERSSPPS